MPGERPEGPGGRRHFPWEKLDQDHLNRRALSTVDGWGRGGGAPVWCVRLCLGTLTGASAHVLLVRKQRQI